MADNYLENQYERYLARKAAWERERKYGKKKKSVHPRPLPQQAEDDVVTDSEEVMLHPFHTSVTDIPLPEKFTYPFCYTPHPLCIAAVKEVQDYLGRQDRWKEELAQGKMFGVLVVETDKGEIGYLAAFSGILAGKNVHPFFVPPVYDLLQPQGFFKTEEEQISQINVRIRQLEEDEAYRRRIEQLTALQQKLFGQFKMLNHRGEVKTLCDIFEQTVHKTPPAGAGECAAPKLLQQAYLHGWKPIAMAEFWWGESPKTEIRHHGHYYPACKGKCEPILRHMLQGLEVDENPMLKELQSNKKELEIIYEDEWLAVVNKPAGMLSVPGKEDAASVYSVVRERYPDADGPLIVHRLDMATSGLLVVAKTKQVHQNLQAQFKNRSIQKRYIALLQGMVSQDTGTVELPLCPNPLDRPRQMVHAEYGKPAVTDFEVLKRGDNRTRIAFYPRTGRTHQLRVHAAHPLGLHCPIIGDELYGKKAERLYLHAETLEFTHPITGKQVRISRKADF